MKFSSLVSIIIPTYNRAHLIGETLDSVLAQTYTNWECIVVDDRSSDNTSAVVSSFSEKDKRFYFYQRPDYLPKGGNTCRNFGFGKSKGNYIQWLDSDDILLPKKIEMQVDCLEQESEDAVVICKFGYFQHSLKNSFLRENIGTYQNFNHGENLLTSFGKNKEYFPIHAYLVPREIILKVGLWDENLKINQDGEFFTRVLLNSGAVKFVNTGVFYRVIGQNNVSEIDSKKKAQDTINSWKIINNHLKRQLKVDKHPYTEGAKRIMLQRIEKKYPELVDDNYGFFKSVIPLHKRIIKKIF